MPKGAAAVPQATKMQDGDWCIVLSYNRHKIMHRCSNAVFSWDRTRYKKAWSVVKETRGSNYLYYRGCLACDTMPPAEMQGMVKLLDWER